MTYKYDEKENLIEENSYNSVGSLISKYTHKYNEKGNKIEMNLYYPVERSLKSCVRPSVFAWSC